MLTNKTATLPIEDYIYLLGRQARQASLKTISVATEKKNACLRILIRLLQEQREQILQANMKDMQLANSKKLSAALVDRLELNQDRFQSMVQGVATVIDLADPIGQIDNLSTMPSGIRLGKMRVPIGVVAMIYESRPNVTIDAAILNIKAGNAVILRGGSEAFHTNLALHAVLQQALEESGLPKGLVQYIENTNRESVGYLISMQDNVDLVIPRGGKNLIERVSQEAKVNVLKHLDGNCHVYIHESADLDMANEIAWNAKTRRYGVCNAMETLLVDVAIAKLFLPPLLQRLSAHGVELRLCQDSIGYGKSLTNIKPAIELDWTTEYLGPILAIKLVDGLDHAIDHINNYGSHHTDAIVTNDLQTSQVFLAKVDSSSVIVNASTAFADGAEYGLGAEIGISTDKFHARGPIGLEGLTCQKYIVLGQGEIRS